MSKLNQKLQLNKENIATLDNMNQIYGGQPGDRVTYVVNSQCPALCPPKPVEKCTHSVCSCC